MKDGACESLGVLGVAFYGCVVENGLWEKSRQTRIEANDGSVSCECFGVKSRNFGTLPMNPSNDESHVAIAP